jgi:3-dehydroquinate synthase
MRPTLVGRINPRPVPIFIAQGILERAAELLGSGRRRRSLALVSDKTVFSWHGERLIKALAKSGWHVEPFLLKPGEGIKSARTIARLHEEWFEKQYDRSTPVIAFGGGTVGDAAGYAAATFLRGLPLWQVPTTIVGQVDSALGGKVGINHARGKNLIGCFYQPTGVLIDPSLLATLPQRELRSGLAEVVKYGIIANVRLFESCEQQVESWVHGDTPFDEDTICRCVKIKLSVVERDETDQGLRHILNFGHTLGHAFERWGNYRRFRHGEAVTLGMMAVGRIAVKRRMMSDGTFSRMGRVCRVLAPAPRRATFRASDIMSHLGFDKKRKDGRQVWVLPERIGKVTMVDNVTDKEIRDAIDFVSGWLKEK